MLDSIGLVVLGLVVLVAASDRLVVSAVRIARTLGISAVLIGAVIVGLGTSLPELLVSAFAARDGELDVAMANVVGSNVANVTLVIGFSAVLTPLVAHWRILRREGMLMLVALFALTGVLFDKTVSRTEGIGLVVGLVVALALLTVWSLRDGEEPEVEESPRAGRSLPWEFIAAIVALTLTVAAANLLLDGALDIGEQLGLSATFLGIMLGVGTSLPELATALAAARRGQSDLVIGNVLGSNIFNSLAVAGLAGIVGAGPLQELDSVLVGLMLLAAVAAGIFSRTAARVSRMEGVLLIALFVGFTVRGL